MAPSGPCVYSTYLYVPTPGKESVIKNRNVWFPIEVDSAFNLTSTYRLDSDIPRRFGSIKRTLINIYVREAGDDDRLLSPDEHINKLMSEKFAAGESLFNTAWAVSNCHETTGAKMRWRYGSTLISSGS